jgi:hypothetical protein
VNFHPPERIEISAERSRERRGFVLVNGSLGSALYRQAEEATFFSLRKAGWRIAQIRPIVTSLEVKLYDLPPEVLQSRVFKYTLCILENPRSGDAAQPA